MKENITRSKKRANRSSRGVALVLVLAGLVLISLIVLAIFTTVNHTVISTKLYTDVAEAKRIGDSAADVIMAQIRAATADSTRAWVSQPGLIRSAAANGTIQSYKLFSADQLFVDGDYDPQTPTQEAPPAALASPGSGAEVITYLDANAGRWTDMNRPTIVRKYDDAASAWRGVAHYPILSPAALDPVTANRLNGKATIGVNGFDVAGNFLKGDPSTLLDGTDFSGAGGSVPRIPMPVKWLYVLKDGKIVPAADGAAGGEVSVPAASPLNPIVARIAFWTDDETCKVNLNTASGDEWNPSPPPSGGIGYTPGAFHDIPYFSSLDEGYLARNQPVADEYQRFPGHPASTYLSAVFPDLTRDQLALLTPRVSNRVNGDTGAVAGSQGGTVTTSDLIDDATKIIHPDSARLYPSVDEVVFSPKMTGSVRQTLADWFGTTGAGSAVLDADRITQSRFFLTTESRAPELNLFSRPRVSLWPIPEGKRTPFDELIAKCATLGGKPFYFTRSDARSPTFDYASLPRNREVFTYLTDVMSEAIPGPDKSFVDKWGSQLRDQILTNCFDYIRTTNLHDSFSSSPGPTQFDFAYAERFQISPNGKNVDALDGAGEVAPILIPATPSGNSTKGLGRFSTIRQAMLAFVGSEVTVGNELSGNTAEEDKKYEVTSLKFRVVIMLDFFNPSQGTAGYYPKFLVRALNDGNFTVSSGGSSGGGNLVSAGSDKMWTGASPQAYSAIGGNMGMLGSFFFDQKAFQKQYYHRFPVTMPSDGSAYFGNPVYPFVSDEITISSPAPTMNFALSAPMRFGVYMAEDVADPNPELVQEFVLEFPSGSIPTPLPMARVVKNTAGGPEVRYAKAMGAKKGSPPANPPLGESTNPTNSLANLNFRMFSKESLKSFPNTGPLNDTAFSNGAGTSAFHATDVLRSVEVYDASNKGDLRISGIQPTVTVSSPMRDYSNQTRYQAANFRSDRGPMKTREPVLADIQFPATGGKLIIGGKFPNYTEPNAELSRLVPDVAAQSVQNEVPLSPNRPEFDSDQVGTTVAHPGGLGDWDTGIADWADGPYINKADEGGYEAGADSLPYFGGDRNAAPAVVGGFSPNRMLPSAVYFGSLPVGPWQTLLFNPNPASIATSASAAKRGGNHPGWTNAPRDHFLLDLFWMPVVEPYAISEPMSTAGKVNMNFQIAPFPYITRTTALQAVLRGTRVTALPDSESINIKNNINSITDTPGVTANLRYPLNLQETLGQFSDRFAGQWGDFPFFLSASEICEIFLVPDTGNITRNTVAAWWSDKRVTGDNLRERPFASLYPRLTTRSNTFRVHVIVQTLQKNSSSSQNVFSETKDSVTSELRGSYLVERAIDPADPRLEGVGPDAIDPDTDPLNDAYRLRVVSFDRFSP